MLDNRLKTFLEVCKYQSYTKAAKALHITQPAVSQQIRHLEQAYGVQLIIYENKQFRLTEQGEKLQAMATVIQADSERIRQVIAGKQPLTQLVFGATRTIGEFVMPDILAEFLKEYPDVKVEMLVDNTQNLQDMMKKGEVMFALVEGEFDREKYEYHQFSAEPFLAVCSPGNELAAGTWELKDLLCKRIFLREKGSGTRNILEHILWDRGMRMSDFSSVCEIGNVNAIKKLVVNDLGISFLYRQAVWRELEEGILCEIQLADVAVIREFNLIMLRSALVREEYLNFLKYCKQKRRP